ncbi:MAG: Stk1 family PASTA domain-containing Ser/Thr kinase [Clostridia bacterium]|nr:Stk1 family PASTA domain-containing Ser/Thr kinase [Clostridia bacterium]
MESYERYVGQVFDNRYRIEKIIGVGGMAVVFKATDTLMRREVAVKILKEEIAADTQSVQRFINESKAVAMLSHQNIVNIYDVSVRENVKYIVMEYVEGITLKSYIEHREILSLKEIIGYTTQILRGLAHAHKKKIVHRDIKPQNIMLLKNGVIKVTDFGIAKLPNADTLTVTDKAIGTVFYISPEQASGKKIDARSDLYSLGVMMYEMATGKLPFTADSPVSVALMQVNDEPKSPREINPNIPVGLEQIILRAMEKDPGDRYQSAEEMLAQISELRENPKIVFKEKKKKANKNSRSASDQTKQGKKRQGGRQSHAMFPIILGVTVAFLIVGAIAGYYVLDKLIINNSLNDYINIKVDNFTGVSYTEDLQEWFRLSSYYTMPDVTYVYSDTAPAGVIVNQKPTGDETRKVLPGKQKCTVQLEVSLGQRMITIDDYTVMDYRNAESELRRLGLKVRVEYEENNVLDIGYVIRTDPEAGASLKENDTITLYVSKGAELEKTYVPDFSGMNEAQILLKLMESKLEPGSVLYVKSERTPGTMVTQSISPWASVPVYSKVDFTISGGASYSGDGKTRPTAEDMKSVDNGTGGTGSDDGGGSGSEEGSEDTVADTDSGGNSETGHGEDWFDD